MCDNNNALPPNFQFAFILFLTSPRFSIVLLNPDRTMTKDLDMTDVPDLSKPAPEKDEKDAKEKTDEKPIADPVKKLSPAEQLATGSFPLYF